LRFTACSVFVGIAIATRIVDSWGPYKASLLFASLLLRRHQRLAGQRRTLSADGRIGSRSGGWFLRRPIPCSSAAGDRAPGASLPPRWRSTLGALCRTGGRLGIGGVLYANDQLHAAGYVAMAFVALALLTVLLNAQDFHSEIVRR